MFPHATYSSSFGARVAKSALGLFALCAAFTSCRSLEKLGSEWKGGEDEIRWMTALPSLKDPSKKNNAIYLSVQDITGDLGEATVRAAVEEAMRAKGYKVEADANVADFQLKVVIRNIYEGAPIDRIGRNDHKETKDVKFTLVADVRLAERVPEGLVVKSDVREGTALSEDILSGNQGGHSTGSGSFAWVRENRVFYAVHQARAMVFNKGSGLFSGKATSVKNMNKRLAVALPGLFPAIS